MLENEIIIPENDRSKRCIIFKLSDYDMNKDERKEKYKDYNIVLCEICNQKINPDWHCKKCYEKETDEEKYRMIYGKCKGCFQVMKIRHWCSNCNSKRFKQDFVKWSSENEFVDELIKDNQTSACDSEHLLEWIPYDKFMDVKFLAKGGFAEVYSAIWKDGRIKEWDQELNKWKRSEPLEVAIKVLNNSENPLNRDFLSEINFLKKFPCYHHTNVIYCYGITREPISRNYALVFKLKDGSLRTYLDENYDSLTLKDKLDIIERICLALDCIHSHNIIHRDLHSGNILHSLVRDKTPDISISDFGFCKPAHEVSKSDKRVYGIMPYMAPEILRGKGYTKKSDIYSFGVIINEILFGEPPFHSQGFDDNLVLRVCEGLRPKIRTETPGPMKELIQRCWDPEPTNRPDTGQIFTMLRDFMYAKKVDISYDYRKYTDQYETLKELKYNKVSEEAPPRVPIIISPPTESHETHPKFVRKIMEISKRIYCQLSHSFKSKSSRYMESESNISSDTEDLLSCAINHNNN